MVGVIGHAELPVTPGVELIPVQAALAEQVTADRAHRGGLEADPARAAPLGQVHLLDGLRGDGFAVHHFTLLAGEATVRGRLARRSLGTEVRRGSWTLNQLSDSLQRLRAPEFAQHIQTDQLTVSQVADTIASSAGLTISPSTDGPLRASLRRYATTIRNVRFD